MSSYLNQRMQRVKISNCRSSWKILNKGVPQGSILGPLLFNVFMNDMFLFMERCNLYNYADDNSIIYSSPDIETVILNLKHDCQNAIQWFTNNGMKANPNKFQFMVISSKQMEPQNIEMHGGVSITSESGIPWSTSYGLGTSQVTFETLDWSQMWRYRNAYTLTCFSTRSFFMIYRLDIFDCIFWNLHIIYLHPYLYSRILAYWLMLSVLQTTENKFYLILSYLRSKKTSKIRVTGLCAGNSPVCTIHHCSLNRLFRRRSKKTSKLRVTGLCAENSPATSEFPAQMASNAENVSIWWRHHKLGSKHATNITIYVI